MENDCNIEFIHQFVLPKLSKSMQGNTVYIFSTVSLSLLFICGTINSLRLVLSETECTVRVALPKPLIN